MTTSQFVAAVILTATGKVSTAVYGDSKWNKVIGIANLQIENWQNEADVDWESLYDPKYSLGTVTDTDTYDLGDDIRKISDRRTDPIRIIHTDGRYTDYRTVSPNRLKSVNGNCCAKIGRTLVFAREFEEDDLQFGGEIQVPVYLYAELLQRPGDIVPVDIPNWLVQATAAEFVRNDITRQNQHPNLISGANQLMLRMKADNEASQDDQIDRPWGAPGADW